MARLQARSGIARSGATRSNDFSANPVVTINGTDRTSAVLLSSLSVSLAKNDQPSTARFAVKPGSGFTPITSQIVYVSLGSADNRLFGGQIIRLTYRYEQGFDDPWIEVDCDDFGRLLDRRIVNAEYTSESATAIALDLVSRFTSGFTTEGIASGLATIDFVAFTNETVRGCFLRLATMLGGGAILPDANRVIHLWDATGDTTTRAGTNPTTLTASLSTLKQFSSVTDATQIRTQTFCEGIRTKLLIAVPTGTHHAAR